MSEYLGGFEGVGIGRRRRRRLMVRGKEGEGESRGKKGRRTGIYIYSLLAD